MKGKRGEKVFFLHQEITIGGSGRSLSTKLICLKQVGPKHYELASLLVLIINVMRRQMLMMVCIASVCFFSQKSYHASLM